MKRPVAVAATTVWLFEALFGALSSLPLWKHLRGFSDDELFQPGGLFLLETLRLGARSEHGPGVLASALTSGALLLGSIVVAMALRYWLYGRIVREPQVGRGSFGSAGAGASSGILGFSGLSFFGLVVSALTTASIPWVAYQLRVGEVDSWLALSVAYFFVVVVVRTFVAAWLDTSRLLVVGGAPLIVAARRAFRFALGPGLGLSLVRGALLTAHAGAPALAYVAVAGATSDGTRLLGLGLGQMLMLGLVHAEAGWLRRTNRRLTAQSAAGG